MVNLSMTEETRLHNVGMTISSTNGTGEIGQLHVKKMKLDHYLISYTKIRSKWIKVLNVRLDTIRFLKENIGRALSDTNHSNIFFDLSPRIMKIKINKWDLLKLKSFCTAKKTISKLKR